MEIKTGSTHRVLLNGYRHTVKAHVAHVLKSHYQCEELIVFKYFGKYSRHWHQDMLTDYEFKFRTNTTKRRFTTSWY